MISPSLKKKLTRHPTTIIIVAAVLTLVSFTFVYFEIDSMGESERIATQEIRELETIRGQIVFYGEILTSSTLMAAVTGNDAFIDRFLEHQILLAESLENMRLLLGVKNAVSSLTEDSTFKLLGYETEAIGLIQENRADEARHMLFGPEYQQQKIRHGQAIATLDDRVDGYIEQTNNKIAHVRNRTQRFIIAAIFLVLSGWVFVLALINWWQQEIRQLAFFDPLTNLASRRYFMLQIDKEIKAADRNNVGLTVLFMDLDGFKDVNDSMGHDVGDFLLKEIASRLTSAARETDFIARLGGDEFCILLENCTHPKDVEKSVERYIEAIEEPVELSARQFRPRTSIGIARYPQDGTDAQVLMKSADSAMYSAKEAGKHGYEYYNAELTDQAEQQLALIDDLREAFHRDEFLLHYQPIVNMDSGLIESVEALVRWQHPQRGLVPPLEFISQLESMGMIDKLGEWVLQRASTEAQNWTSNGKPLRVAVNIFPQHFLNVDFVDSVKQIVDQANFSTDRITLEITESWLQNSELGFEKYGQLRDMGFKLAIDDFGTGFSSLDSLLSMPIDILKIDRIFIQNMLESSRDYVMLEAILGMARALDIRVVIEGVEVVEQVRALKALGCDMAQGYFFNRPLDAVQLSTLLESDMPVQVPGSEDIVRKAG